MLNDDDDDDDDDDDSLQCRWLSFHRCHGPGVEHFITNCRIRTVTENFSMP